MAYTTINKPSDYFNTKLYTGNGTNNTSITGVGFQPDLLWIKDRTNVNNHSLQDAVRGAGYNLQTNTTNAQGLATETISSFDTDGWTMNNGGGVNGSGASFVAWNWLAGTSVSGNTTGNGTAKTYTGSVNTASGFSITKFVGNGTAGHTIPHNLGAVPKIIILKDLDDVTHWNVYTEATGNTRSLLLTDSGIGGTSAGYWNNTTPTSSVFTLGSDADLNGNDGNFIAYCFAEKKGFSKFGSYTGNGSTDGTFVYTGFKPAFVLIKANASADWYLIDNKRSTFNVMEASLKANTSDAESTTIQDMDFLSNGFKPRSTSGSTNGSGTTYIYMAFAEAPLVGSNNIPATAR